MKCRDIFLLLRVEIVDAVVSFICFLSFSVFILLFIRGFKTRYFFMEARSLDITLQSI